MDKSYWNQEIRRNLRSSCQLRLEDAIAHDKDRDGEENGHAGANFSGDEQQGGQLGLDTRGARVGMS